MIKILKKLVGAVTPTKRKYTISKDIYVKADGLLNLPSKTWYSKN